MSNTMKFLLFSALFSTVAVADTYPANYIDFSLGSFGGVALGMTGAKEPKPAPAVAAPPSAPKATPEFLKMIGQGSGPYKAKMWGEMPGLLNHTIFAPENPPKDLKSPVIL
jgi:hypothetical protein